MSEDEILNKFDILLLEYNNYDEEEEDPEKIKQRDAIEKGKDIGERISDKVIDTLDLTYEPADVIRAIGVYGGGASGYLAHKLSILIQYSYRQIRIYFGNKKLQLEKANKQLSELEKNQESNSEKIAELKERIKKIKANMVAAAKSMQHKYNNMSKKQQAKVKSYKG